MSTRSMKLGGVSDAAWQLLGGLMERMAIGSYSHLTNYIVLGHRIII